MAEVSLPPRKVREIIEKVIAERIDEIRAAEGERIAQAIEALPVTAFTVVDVEWDGEPLVRRSDVFAAIARGTS